MASDDASMRPTWISEHVPPEIVQSKLFKFSIHLPGGGKIAVDTTNDVEIDYECLEEQMDRVSGQYVWWASVYSEARAAVTVFERRISIRRGKLIETALQAARENSTRLTNEQAEKIIEIDDTLNKWEVTLALMQRDVGKLYHMVKAIEMKSELLRSRSGFKRKEQDLQRHQT